MQIVIREDDKVLLDVILEPDRSLPVPRKGDEFDFAGVLYSVVRIVWSLYPYKATVYVVRKANL